MSEKIRRSFGLNQMFGIVFYTNEGNGIKYDQQTAEVVMGTVETLLRQWKIPADAITGELITQIDDRVLEALKKAFCKEAEFSVKTTVDGDAWPHKLLVGVTLNNAPEGGKFEDINLNGTIGWVSVENLTPTYTASHPDGINPRSVLVAIAPQSEWNKRPGSTLPVRKCEYGHNDDKPDRFWTTNFEGRRFEVDAEVLYWRYATVQGPLYKQPILNGFEGQELNEKHSALKAHLATAYEHAQRSAENSHNGYLSEDEATRHASDYVTALKEFADEQDITLGDSFVISVSSDLTDILEGNGDWEIPFMGLDFKFLVY